MARSSHDDVVMTGTASPYWRPVLEWMIWVGFALLAYSQTSLFDDRIPQYRFGATGWPRAVCMLMIVGATGQLLLRYLDIRRGMAAEDEMEARQALTPMRLAQRAAIFILPLIYLYSVPWVGFYFASPVFVILLMLVLEVRSPKALIGVTFVIFAAFLIIFTRYFYVALPVGNLPFFYDINNAIIMFARIGL